MKIVIMGASSGLGAELASIYIEAGHEVACASRRTPQLPRGQHPALFEPIDVNSPDAPALLLSLIDRLGGMDLYIHAAGIGYDNPALAPDREAAIAATNCVGFARMISTAFNWFADRRVSGQIAAISSVAGTKALVEMEAYCASKRFGWVYLQGLRRRARRDHLPIRITDIRPGWTRTPLLKAATRYPLLMEPDRACRLIFKAISRRRKIAYIDRRWHLLCLLWRLLPL